MIIVPQYSDSIVIQIVNVMNLSFSPSAVAENPAEEFARQSFAQARPNLQNHGKHMVAGVADRRTVVGSGVTIPRFLTSRIGLKWSEILAELRSAAGSESEYHCMLHGLTEFVETNVIGTWIQPRHGSGLLAGQPLTIGWRRRLYVCPATNQLQRIPSADEANVPAGW